MWLSKILSQVLAKVNGSYLRRQLYRAAVYSLIYSSFAISLLFTIGGALFSIPPVCSLLGIGIVGQVLVGSICTFGAFWGTYLVQGVCLRNLILDLANLQDEIPAHDKQSSAGLLTYFFVSTLLVSNAVFYIAGGYFAMLQILSFLGLQNNLFAAVGSLFTAIIGYLPTFALNGVSMIQSELGHSKIKKVIEVNELDLNIDDNAVILPKCSIHVPFVRKIDIATDTIDLQDFIDDSISSKIVSNNKQSDNSAHGLSMVF